MRTPSRLRRVSARSGRAARSRAGCSAIWPRTFMKSARRERVWSRGADSRSARDRGLSGGHHGRFRVPFGCRGRNARHLPVGANRSAVRRTHCKFTKFNLDGEIRSVAAALPPGYEAAIGRGSRALQFVAAEEVVLVAGWAVRASQAADEKHRNADRHQHGEHASVRRKPMNRHAYSRTPAQLLAKCLADEPGIRAIWIEHRTRNPGNPVYHRQKFCDHSSDLFTCPQEKKRRK